MAIQVNFSTQGFSQLAAQLQQLAKMKSQLQGSGSNRLPNFGGGGSGGVNLGQLGYGLARAGGLGQFSALAGRIAMITTKLGPWGTAIGVVVAALGAFAHAMHTANEVLNTWSKTFWKSGATQKGAQGVAGIAMALGMDPGSAASKAGSMPGGSAQFLAMVRNMLAIKDDRAAFYMARATGLEDYLGLRDLSKENQAKALSGSSTGYTKEDRQQNAEFNMAWGEVTMLLRKSLVTVLIPAFKMAIPLLEAWANQLKLLVKVLTWGGKVISYIYGPLINLFKWIAKITGMKEKQSDSIDKFSSAVEQFTNAVGVFGGIANDRAKGAYPQAYAWYGNQMNMIFDSKHLGAFPL